MKMLPKCVAGCACAIVACAAGTARGYVANVLYQTSSPPGVTWNGSVTAGGNFIEGHNTQVTAGTQAILWTPSSGPNGIDLTPAGGYGYTFGTRATQQVGAGSTSNSNPPHALLWSGTPGSIVDLNPTSLPKTFITSQAMGVGGGQQVGFGAASGATNQSRALLWNGTATSAIDLTPSTNLSGVDSYRAWGTDGVHQVGYAYDSSFGFNRQALLWSGNAASIVNLNPTGFNNTVAYGVSGNQQVGDGSGPTTGGQHALLWTGTPDSYVDLNPAGLIFGEAFGTNGSKQVGYGHGSVTNNIDHALLWSGSAGSMVDLGALLPAFYDESEAFTIDAAGNVYGIGLNTQTGNMDVIEWTATPEPSTLALFGFAAGGLLLRRRRKLA